ncbi:MAG: hypothetical protein A2Y98_03635 [Candidatus Portnoybacteria bacterium RBG_19FT_COMBO_36_7]|uniref:A-factor biosynthesis hotdog domain-containing protein n=1 Tax=Candidatus Portnoybacteria bacterium RBG_19FT_COMBO_36_7 TaxID=1801992 RepID=A0A1G2F726_9BACT|nr:MAG: hypothetical protein A2Y98_03635 [Candidatus Portnoybacteria bacterium RBG_19FT_COMBO_36_7]
MRALITETGHHHYKFAPSKHHLKEILPQTRHLIKINTFLPGEKAEGLAHFKEDTHHHPGQSILLASEITQALLEISEFAIRSKFSLQKFIFLGFDIRVKIRKTVPIRNFLQLPVFAQKTGGTARSSDAPSGTHGEIKAALLAHDKKNVLAELSVKFKLQQTSI